MQTLQQTTMSVKARATAAHPHRGYGKLIMFGEHFVVYQRPAFVAALEAYTWCEVELTPETEWGCGLVVRDVREAVPGYKDEKKDEMLESTKIVLKHFGVDPAKRGVAITFGGPLCAVSGVGASAASCVALARALAEALGRKLTEEEINAAAFEGEKGYHGTPSGIDNTAATYGGVLRFQRSATQGAPPSFESRKLVRPVLVVYAGTGITSSTTKVVGEVAKKRAENPQWYEALQKRYESVFARADEAFRRGDWDAIGKLCDENHALLQELGVSCKELDELVAEARRAGAAGAKLAGTGQGGLMFAVCRDAASQRRVFEALSKKAPQAWMTSFL